MLGHYKMSMIGTSHQAKAGGVCQDASDVLVLENGWVVASIADGLGSARRSEVGAATAVKTVLSFVRENHPEKWHEGSLIALLMVAYHKALNTIKAIAAENGDAPRDYDTTLTTAIYNGTNVVYGHVGDGGIIALSPYGDFSVLTKAQKGEVFNETYPLRAGPENWLFGASKEDVCALTLMTDGIFDIAYPWLLARTDQPIYINYVRPFMDINILKVSTPADFESVEEEVKDFFNGQYSRQITDDKTIVGIINTDVTPEIKSDEYYREPDWEALAKRHHDGLYGRTDAEPEAPEAPPEEGALCTGVRTELPEQAAVSPSPRRDPPAKAADEGRSPDAKRTADAVSSFRRAFKHRVGHLWKNIFKKQR